MIPSHYELNVARNGGHFANIVFPFGISAIDAQERADDIRTAFYAAYSRHEFEFRLTYVECVGHFKEF
jgi:hypothetical protein